MRETFAAAPPEPHDDRGLGDVGEERARPIAAVPKPRKRDERGGEHGEARQVGVERMLRPSGRRERREQDLARHQHHAPDGDERGDGDGFPPSPDAARSGLITDRCDAGESHEHRRR